MASDIENQSDRFEETIKQIDSVYADYARSVGLNFTNLYILHMVAITESCTQKMIVEQTFLPKQTVHSVISAFCRQGIMELRESSEDRRMKTIHLTETGHTFADNILPRITAAEATGMAQFTADERKKFLEFIKRFADAFEKALRKN